MKLKLLAPIICAAAATLASGGCGNKDNGDGDGDGDTATGGTASGGDSTSSGGLPGSGGAASGGSNTGGIGTGGDGEGGADNMGGEGGEYNSALVLTATDFDDGEELPDEFTCEGEEFGDGISPELSWSGAAEGTETYALVFMDTTLVGAGLPQFGYHWVAWNIPVSVDGIPASMTGEEEPPALSGGSQFRAGPDLGHDAFFGPCPSWKAACENGTPRSHDEYAFVLYTFDEAVTVPEFDDTNYDNYAHQLDEFLAEQATDSTQLATASDAAPGVKPTVPACPAFAITATDFDYGDALPDENTCEDAEFGDGISPELAWEGAPEGTVTYALVFADTTLLGVGLPQVGYHWAAWNIPVTVDGIPANMTGEEEPPALSGGSQFRAGPPAPDNAFFGPCPSWQVACDIGAERSNDTYQFILYAFDDELEVPVFDDTNYDNYVHQLDEFFKSATPLGKTALEVTSDAAPGVEPTIPECPALTFTAAGLTEGGEIPDANTCEAKAADDGVSPEFSWTDPYPLTETYAIVLRGITSNRTLWIAWDIPATATGVAADVGDGTTPAKLGGGSQVSRDPLDDPTQYYTPCPSWNSVCNGNTTRVEAEYTYTLYTFEDDITPNPDDLEAFATYLEANADNSAVISATSDALPSEEPDYCP